MRKGNTLCGGRCMISGVAISIPRPMAGKPDVIMMIHNISTGESGKTEIPLESLKTSPISRVLACAMFYQSESASREGRYFSQQMKNELFDIVKHPASFLNSIDNRCKVIVRQHNIRRIFRNITARQSHRNTNVGPLQRRRIIHPITCNQPLFDSRGYQS